MRDGGQGGKSFNGQYATNAVYGDYRNPNEFGTGGYKGTPSFLAQTPGGGLIRIVADTLQVDGAINADGIAGEGAGSGGGIRLDVGTLSGNGTISANGGALSGSTSFASGGGGRIAAYYTDKSGFTGNITANGGYYSTSSSKTRGCGGAGTVYMKTPTQQYGDLIIDNNGYYTREDSTPLRAIGSGISNSIIFSLTTGQSTLTNSNANWPLPNTTTGALGLKGLILNPNTNQSGSKVTFAVVDNTATTIIVEGDMTQVATGGNPYIGEYTFNNLTVSGRSMLYTQDRIFVINSINGSGDGGVVAQKVVLIGDTITFDNVSDFGANINQYATVGWLGYNGRRMCLYDLAGFADIVPGKTTEIVQRFDAWGHKSQHCTTVRQVSHIINFIANKL